VFNFQNYSTDFYDIWYWEGCGRACTGVYRSFVITVYMTTKLNFYNIPQNLYVKK